ncbi:MAG: hypothetical protein KKG10_15095 [Proteobacteria bacterium]|nr:hypothetical protein [Pseudomonadota bacterium]
MSTDLFDNIPIVFTRFNHQGSRITIWIRLFYFLDRIGGICRTSGVRYAAEHVPYSMAKHGYGVIWTDEMDLSESEVWIKPK